MWRFFIGFFLSFYLVSATAEDIDDGLDLPACRTAEYDEIVNIKKVIDGDTVILDDERHVRLLGINTPEIGRDGKVSESGAKAARDYLTKLLHTNKRLHLVYDAEKQDRYERTLAHLFLPDGLNVQSLMLIRGLAATLTIPPNIRFLDCYQSSVRLARENHIGLWALRDYQPLPVTGIDIKNLGFRIITGTVSRIGESRSAIWINFERRVALRITREDLDYFDIQSLKKLAGSQVLAQGWLYLANGEFRMRIRHPVDLTVLTQN